MAYRKLKMIEVKEVLRRREAGQSLRRIARDTGLDRKTARRYAEALERAEGDDEERVQQMVREVQSRPAVPASAPRKKLEAHRDQVRDWLFPKQPGATRVAAHEGARAAGPARRRGDLRDVVPVGPR